jgi:hypothetical protein
MTFSMEEEEENKPQTHTWTPPDNMVRDEK